MTVEEQAARCRRGLDATLRSMHKLTSDPQSAAELLLRRMNDVLRAAFDSNFGAPSRDAINTLYESIDRERDAMLDDCNETRMLFFARSFAPVLEEAVRQLQQLRETVQQLQQQNTATVPRNTPYSSGEDSRRSGPPVQQLLQLQLPNTATVPRNAPYSSGETSMHSDTPREKEQFVKKEEETERKLVAPAAATTAAAVRTPQQLQQQPAAAVAVGSEPATIFPHPSNPNLVQDFSPSAVKGLIKIKVPHSVREEEILAILRPFGHLLNFWNANPSKYVDIAAFARFESNELADAAVGALDGSKLDGGGTLAVIRSRCWERPKTQGDRNAIVPPTPLFGYKRETKPNTATVPCHAPYSSVETAMRSETPKEEEKFVKKEENEVKKEEETERKSEASATAASAAAVRTPQQLQLQRPAAAVAVHPARDLLVRHPTNPDKVRIRVTCPADLKGRIKIHNVPPMVSEEEIRTFLRPFGVLHISYWDARKCQKDFGSVFVQLQSNEAADAAVNALNSSGGTVRAERATYWYKWKTIVPRAPTAPRDRIAHDEPAPLYKGPLPAAAAAAVDCVPEATVDSDDETEGLRSNLSRSSSFFSVD